MPEKRVGFTEELESKDFTSDLDQRFKEDPYCTVPVLFEGRLYRPPLYRSIWFGLVSKFGVRDQRAPIIIKRYLAVGKPGDTKLIDLPDSHP